MVLVLAALYSFYHHNQKLQQRNNQKLQQRKAAAQPEDDLRFMTSGGFVAVVPPTSSSSLPSPWPQLTTRTAAATVPISTSTRYTNTQSNAAKSSSSSYFANNNNNGLSHQPRRSLCHPQLQYCTMDSPVFRDSVRKDWLRIVFGNDFLRQQNSTSVSAAGTMISSTSPTTSFGPLYPTVTKTLVRNQSRNYKTFSSAHTHGRAESSSSLASSSSSSSSSSFNFSDPTPKLGMTLAPKSVGLYVHHIVPGGEASMLGTTSTTTTPHLLIPAGAILVRVNQHCVLTESTKTALTQVWQCESSCPSPTVLEFAVNDHDADDDDAPDDEHHNSLSLGCRRVRIVLVTRQWGIAWAPAVQVCAVKKAYAQAAHVGIVRNSWLLAVNQHLVSDLQHAREAFLEPSHNAASPPPSDSATIQVILALPPPSSSTCNASMQSSNGSSNYDHSTTLSEHLFDKNIHLVQQQPATSPIDHFSLDGVQVKFHALDTALTDFYRHVSTSNLLKPVLQGNAYGSNINKTSTDTASAKTTSMRDLPSPYYQCSPLTWAHHVAKGQVILEAPPPFFNRQDLQQQQLSSPPQPLSTSAWVPPHPAMQSIPLTSPILLNAWDPVESLVFALRMHAAEYQADALMAHPMLEAPVEATSFPSGSSITSTWSWSWSSSSCGGDAATWKMKQLLSKPPPTGISIANWVETFLLQFLGIICAGSSSVPTHRSMTNTYEEVEEEEKKDSETLGTTGGESNNTRSITTWAAQQEVTSILLRISRKDQGFCQRLYFLLRSFLDTLESKPDYFSTASTISLLALLNCLERLRFAEGNAMPNNRKARAILKDSRRRLSEPMHDTPKQKQLSSVKPNRAPSPPPAPCPDYSSVDKKGLLVYNPKKKPTHRDGLSNRLNKSTSTPYCQRSMSHTVTTLRSSNQASILPAKDASTLPRRNLILHSSPSPSRSIASMPSNPVHSSLSSSRSIESVPSNPVAIYENMAAFLSELDVICSNIEMVLQKSFRQKMADWALQPWSPSKDSALALVTQSMRKHLLRCNSNIEQDKDGDGNRRSLLLVNPIDSSELFSAISLDECYVLPSAHFPILMTFQISEKRCSDDVKGEEILYRTTVEVIAINAKVKHTGHFAVQAAIAGSISETTHASHPMRSTFDESMHSLYHIWPIGGVLNFETRSSWGAPKTLSLRVTQTLQSNSNGVDVCQELGYGWVDLTEQFLHSYNRLSGGASVTMCTTNVWPVCKFDEHGDALPHDGEDQQIELQLKISTEIIGLKAPIKSDGKVDLRLSRKRILLYKHDEDLRQEAFAVQFVKTCDSLLKASGLDMKLLTFQCVPVGTRRGFVEWVPGSVAMSDLCDPCVGSSSMLSSGEQSRRFQSEEINSISLSTKAGLSKYGSLRNLDGYRTSISASNTNGTATSHLPLSFVENPIQEYLRSIAFDATAPYLINKDVMDTYVKSCAGYSVITYLLGVGDRHLDNLLLHQSGCFFHCDFSFILGSDPKAYIPVRITDDMVSALGGKDSDNYARLISMMGASFLALRRPENVRLLLSLIRLMEHSRIPDISENQSLSQSLQGLLNRFRLDLSDAEAVVYIESLVESALSSRVAKAVDAIHSLGKKF